MYYLFKGIFKSDLSVIFLSDKWSLIYCELNKSYYGILI